MDESELDPEDPWRYCRPPVQAFNDRRRRLVIPSWLLTGDESMSAYTGTEGVRPGAGIKDNHKPIPLLQFIERKPEPLGAEIKVVAGFYYGRLVALVVDSFA